MNDQEIVVKIITWGSTEYSEELEFRNKNLRKPLGLNIYDENLKRERNNYHMGAYLGDTLVGVLMLVPLDSENVKMRQVAVDENYRKLGIGRQILEFAENFAKKEGFKKIVLDARNTAIPFYEKLEYQKRGKEFLQIGVPHLKMYKII